MARSHLILTVDHELFGNGSGDLDACMVGPLDRLLAACERHGRPLTIFVDASELLAMRGTEAAVARVEAQLAGAVRRGHVVQLHLHPQWDGARKVDGRWRLEPRRWRIGDLPAFEVAARVAEGRAYLEDRVEQRVDVFRAGGWAIQPGRPVVDALTRQGFAADSSVAPGRFFRSPGKHFDFRDVPPDAWWPVGSMVTERGVGPLLEIPIATGWIGRRLHGRARWERPQASPEGCGCEAAPVRRRDRARVWLDQARNLGRSMLDFCGLDAAGLAAVEAAWTAGREGEVPLVAIGHSKNFTAWSEAQLDAWLSRCTAEPATYGSWAAVRERP